jgi:hypothetical protein
MKKFLASYYSIKNYGGSKRPDWIKLGEKLGAHCFVLTFKVAIIGNSFASYRLL